MFKANKKDTKTMSLRWSLLQNLLTAFDGNYFCKTHYLRCLTGFWLRLCLLFSCFLITCHYFKGILHYAEFPLYDRRFLSDIVATSLTRCKLEFKKRAEWTFNKNVNKNVDWNVKETYFNLHINHIAVFDWIKCTLSRSRLVQTHHHSLL